MNDMKPGWRGCRALEAVEESPSKFAVSLGSSEVEELMLRARLDLGDCSGEEGGEAACMLLPSCVLVLVLGGASLKTWTVSVADETQSRVDVALKVMQKIRAGMLPLRNW